MPLSSRYRGVVAQRSGKWGAQIYKHYSRIWLGTFRSEAEAAETYDHAARCLHGTNAITNFNSSSFTKPNTDADDDDEIRFLKMHTTAEILSMLRTQTYHDARIDAQRGVMMINFEDEKGKIWRFRYVLWGSSGTHVLNGGWAEFAREKGLRAGDKIKFWRVRNESGNVHLLIECCHIDQAKIEPRSQKMIRLFGFNISVSESLQK